VFVPDTVLLASLSTTAGFACSCVRGLSSSHCVLVNPGGGITGGLALPAPGFYRLLGDTTHACK
jgi:hypothetical protein